MKGEETCLAKSYGVRETTILENEIKRQVEEIRNIGYTIIRQLISPQLLDVVREKLDQLYSIQVAEVGGEDNLKRINDANIVRCPLGHDMFFLELATHPDILVLTTAILGDYVILQQQNGVVLRPEIESYQVAWHRDIPYQHFTSSRPLALSVLWCIDDFNRETGGTVVLPASHKSEVFPSREYVFAHEKGIEAAAGDVLVFDSMLFHRAGNNNHPSKIRRGLNHVYSLPFFHQQINLSKALKQKYNEDPFLRKFLGYETESADSVLAWRTKRLKKFSEQPN